VNRTQLGLCVALVLVASGCQCGGNLHLDPSGGPDSGAPTGNPPDPALPGCASDAECSAQVCRFKTCIDTPTACTTDAECINDSYCHSGECLPYGVGPRSGANNSCKRLQIAGLFSPALQCQWVGPPQGDPFPDHKNVLVTPLVVDFDFDNTPVFESGRAEPSIVFTTYNCDDGSAGQEPGCYGVIRVIDGKTCKQQYSMSGGGAKIIGSVTPALADLNLDGRPDIVTQHIGGGIIGFTYDAASDSFVEMWSGYSSQNGGNGHWDSISVHDLDDDGVPEIVQSGPYPALYRNNGTLLHASSLLTTYQRHHNPVLADVDNDGNVEMVDGKYVHRFDRMSKTWTAAHTSANALGFTAIADFGTYGANPANDLRGTLDGVPEIAVVSASTVRVQTLDGRVVFGPIAIPLGGRGGSPTIGDFDGDGRVEVGVAGGDAYSVFDPDCVAGQPSSTFCPSSVTPIPAAGVLWTRVSQDRTSNMTGSSVFDFEGDGKAEVVYADECFSRVYDGRSGDVLFSQHHTSCTWYEYPIIADVDGDFRSEIVIPSNKNCSVTCPAVDPIHDGLRCESNADCPGTTTCGKTQPSDAVGRCRCNQDAQCGSANLKCLDPIAGPSAAGKVCRSTHPVGVPETGVQVLHDSLDRWVNSRMIWNQHAYAVTHIDENGIVPKLSQWGKNWLDPKLNNFRMNVQGASNPLDAPDLTGNQGSFTCADNGAATLKARICNRGLAPLAAGVPVTFYKESKDPSRVVCTAETTHLLVSGGCDTVSCVWQEAPSAPTRVIISADDDGTGTGASAECQENNNVATLGGVSCFVIN